MCSWSKAHAGRPTIFHSSYVECEDLVNIQAKAMNMRIFTATLSLSTMDAQFNYNQTSGDQCNLNPGAQQTGTNIVLRSDKISSMLFSSNEKYYFQHM
jgi:hypothetical protein